MKIKQLLTKTLLMAAGLLVGTSAWATVTPFSESYSSTSTTTGWATGTSDRYTPTILNDDDNYYLSVDQGTRYNNGATVTGTILSGKAAAGDDFTLIFDVRVGSHNDKTKGSAELQIKDAANTGIIFSLTDAGANSTNWTVNGGSTEYTLEGSNNSTAIGNKSWYTVQISRSGTLTYATITKKSDASVVMARSVVTSSATGGLGNITFATSRYYSNFAIDNIVVRALQDGDVPVVTYYTATFTDNTTSTDVTSSTTIYTDEGRTSTIVNGALEDGNTYYYRATKEGYQNYEGSFTVSAADPAVNFSMTLKPRYTFTVNAVNSVGGATIKTFYTDDDSYDGKAHRVYFPAYLTGAENVVTYSKDNSTWYADYVSASDAATQTQSYTAYTGNAWFFEGEDITGATTYTTSTFAPRSSSGATGVLSAKTITSLAAGVYKITARVIGKASNTCSLYKTSTEGEKIFDVTTSTTGATGIGYITLDATTDIVANGGYYTSTDNGYGFDYILIEKITSVPVTIASSGYSTIASAYALDCANLPSGLKAYEVTSLSASAATIEEVTEAVAPGTGLILQGTADTPYDIPVVASGTDISSTNKLKAAVTATTLDDDTFYVLIGGKFKLVTGTADDAARTVPAGKAYLLASDVPAPASEMALDFGNLTGINEVKGEGLKVNGYYDLQGRKVAQPTKGLYIVNGKKVVIK